ncbi:hypothetical protein [Microbacterium sp. W4I20]|uniref:hypothetical protein n=1 Tax=Microbacterium sp. W4I20 TaxID=3042262 RepID=UPI00278B15BF|nr:hypothetical protein [Microbacterium sp. W4I20]MDQ0726321.1 very-short-patch-repair endonuclease [Microbacterium sp. W4I20]
MNPAGQLPSELGANFSIAEAREAGVAPSRLRANDLVTPFRGARRRLFDTTASDAAAESDDRDGPHAIRRDLLRAGARDYAPRMHPEHFFTSETAAALWGGPLPLPRSREREPSAPPPVHVGVFGTGSLPRIPGVVGHRMRPATISVCELGGSRITTPASTWASLGSLPLHDLVALGDYFCRIWRVGYGRPDAGRSPLATVDELRAATGSGRRVGVRRLREAVELVRTDSWSPRESKVRCVLLDARLPEPRLNIDVFDEEGRFLACVDLAYPDLKVAIEYHGLLHSATYARDVERIARLRAAGWIVLEVTAELLGRPDDLVARVRAAIRSRR